MDGYDLAGDIDPGTWSSLKNCLNESLELIDEQEFLDAAGYPRHQADELWIYLDLGMDAHPLLSTDQLLLAAACVDVAVDLVDDWEFNLRVGFDKPDAVALAALLRSHA